MHTRRAVKMVLFTASRDNNFVGGTCAPLSALLVDHGFHPIHLDFWPLPQIAPRVTPDVGNLSSKFECSMVFGFYRAARMHRADMPSQDVRLSVCLSHAGIVRKRLHISSKFFHHRVAPPF